MSDYAFWGVTVGVCWVWFLGVYSDSVCLFLGLGLDLIDLGCFAFKFGSRLCYRICFFWGFAERFVGALLFLFMV